MKLFSLSWRWEDSACFCSHVKSQNSGSFEKAAAGRILFDLLDKNIGWDVHDCAQPSEQTRHMSETSSIVEV